MELEEFIIDELSKQFTKKVIELENDMIINGVSDNKPRGIIIANKISCFNKPDYSSLGGVKLYSKNVKTK